MTDNARIEGISMWAPYGGCLSGVPHESSGKSNARLTPESLPVLFCNDPTSHAPSLGKTTGFVTTGGLGANVQSGISFT
jgi:hypothetical protein